MVQGINGRGRFNPIKVVSVKDLQNAQNSTDGVTWKESGVNLVKNGEGLESTAQDENAKKKNNEWRSHQLKIAETCAQTSASPQRARAPESDAPPAEAESESEYEVKSQTIIFAD